MRKDTLSFRFNTNICTFFLQPTPIPTQLSALNDLKHLKDLKDLKHPKDLKVHTPLKKMLKSPPQNQKSFNIYKTQ